MTDWPIAQLLVDGKLRDATGGETFDIVNPATEQVIGVAPAATAADVDAALTAARRAFDETSWSTDLQLRAALPAPAAPARWVEHGPAHARSDHRRGRGAGVA